MQWRHLVVSDLPSSGYGYAYGYGTVPGGRWAIDTEGGHVVVSVSRIRNGYEYGRRSRGRFRIPPAIVATCLLLLHEIKLVSTSATGFYTWHLTR